MKQKIICFAMLLILQSANVLAETPDTLLAQYKTEASQSKEFQGFSAQRGESFFKNKHGQEWSCSTCHTDNPANQGKHEKTGKLIKPLAPTANPERFTDKEKVEKWFKRNCNDVLDRVCTPSEKGDFLTYLLSIK